MLVYNKNSSNKFDIWEEKIELVTKFENGTWLSRKIWATLVNTVNSELEAQAFIQAEKNMIEKFECEESLREEFENNLEKV